MTGRFARSEPSGKSAEDEEEAAEGEETPSATRRARRGTDRSTKTAAGPPGTGLAERPASRGGWAGLLETDSSSESLTAKKRPAKKAASAYIKKLIKQIFYY